MMDEGYDIVESSLPVLLTVVKRTEPAAASILKGQNGSKKAEIKNSGIKSLGLMRKIQDLKALRLRSRTYSLRRQEAKGKYLAEILKNRLINLQRS